MPNCCTTGIGRGWLHAPVFDRRSLVFFEVGQDIRGFDRFCRKPQRRLRPHGPSLGHRCAVRVTSMLATPLKARARAR